MSKPVEPNKLRQPDPVTCQMPSPPLRLPEELHSPSRSAVSYRHPVLLATQEAIPERCGVYRVVIFGSTLLQLCFGKLLDRLPAVSFQSILQGVQNCIHLPCLCILLHLRFTPQILKTPVVAQIGQYESMSLRQTSDECDSNWEAALPR